jgi:hypothetical protein
MSKTPLLDLVLIEAKNRPGRHIMIAPQFIEEVHAEVMRAIANPRPAVPEGYKLVPVEPTQAMLDARAACGFESSPKDRWIAMLSAAPQSGGA